MNLLLRKYSLLLFSIAYALVSVFIIYFFNGTGDAGDSIMHYLIARFAPYHPELFFSHWGKPFYVLLASSFAQFGFTGIKVFNAINTGLAIVFTIKTAQQFNLKNALVSGLFLFSMPLIFVLTFSGLTEPLSALMLILSVYLYSKNKIVLSCIIASFIPFVRSEGLIILSVFGTFLIIKKQWKACLFLLTGHLVYSIAGWFIYNDILWVFTKIPYANVGSPYGKGTWLHFPKQLTYVIGIPIYILLVLGILKLWYKTVLKREIKEKLLLIFSLFFAFFLAHAVFWKFGIFNSMGLKRVFVTVSPLIAILALYGFNLIENISNKNVASFLKTGVLFYVLIFLFLPNPSSINWHKDLSLKVDQTLAKNTLTKSDIKNKNIRYAFAHPYFCEVLDIDCFDSLQKIDLSYENIQKMKKGDIIIWDSWFAPTESRVSKKSLASNKKLLLISESNATESNKHFEIAIFSVK